MIIKKDFQVRPKPIRELGREFIGFLVVSVTAALAIGVHWIAGLIFLAICLVASHFADRPKNSQKGGTSG